MFQPVHSFLLRSGHTLVAGDLVFYGGYRMRLERMERVPGGIAAFLNGLPNTVYPHPVYGSGFSCPADSLTVEVAK